ncbi:MAG: DUF4911 domain-containing protein [Ignavibacteriales bacterium]
MSSSSKEVIKCMLEPVHIDKFNRIFEGYDGIGIVSTIDRKAGLVIVRVTPQTYQEAYAIIENVPFSISIVE